jgi:hypothetical protein
VLLDKALLTHQHFLIESLKVFAKSIQNSYFNQIGCFDDMCSLPFFELTCHSLPFTLSQTTFVGSLVSKEALRPVKAALTPTEDAPVAAQLKFLRLLASLLDLDPARSLSATQDGSKLLVETYLVRNPSYCEILSFSPTRCRRFRFR